MSVIPSFNLKDPLEPEHGVCAFDPVTFAIAVHELSTTHGYAVFAPRLVNEPLPETLTHLASITFDEERHSIKVSIDTGHMTWHLGGFGLPREASFLDDGKRSRRGLGLGHQWVMRVQDRYATCLPMRTGDGEDVLIWFAELAPDGTTTDRAALLSTALTLQASWERARTAGLLLEADSVIIPELALEYETRLPCVSVREWAGTEARQKFKVSVDITGARARAETMITATGAPRFEDFLRVTFGARGPLLVWFSPSFEDGASEVLPFCVVRLTSEAFLGADDDSEDLGFDDGDVFGGEECRRVVVEG